MDGHALSCPKYLGADSPAPSIMNTIFAELFALRSELDGFGILYHVERSRGISDYF